MRLPATDCQALRAAACFPATGAAPASFLARMGQAPATCTHLQHSLQPRPRTRQGRAGATRRPAGGAAVGMATAVGVYLAVCIDECMSCRCSYRCSLPSRLQVVAAIPRPMPAPKTC